MKGVTYSVRNKLEAELDHRSKNYRFSGEPADMTVEQALAMKVDYRKEKATLEWLLNNAPIRLNELMERLTPYTRLFQAVSLIYNHPEYSLIISSVVRKRNQKYYEIGRTNGSRNKRSG